MQLTSVEKCYFSIADNQDTQSISFQEEEFLRQVQDCQKRLHFYASMFFDHSSDELGFNDEKKEPQQHLRIKIFAYLRSLCHRLLSTVTLTRNPTAFVYAKDATNNSTNDDTVNSHDELPILLPSVATSIIAVLCLMAYQCEECSQASNVSNYVRELDRPLFLEYLDAGCENIHSTNTILLFMWYI